MAQLTGPNDGGTYAYDPYGLNKNYGAPITQQQLNDWLAGSTVTPADPSAYIQPDYVTAGGAPPAAINWGRLVLVGALLVGGAMLLEELS